MRSRVRVAGKVNLTNQKGSGVLPGAQDIPQRPLPLCVRHALPDPITRHPPLTRGGSRFYVATVPHGELRIKPGEKGLAQSPQLVHITA